MIPAMIVMMGNFSAAAASNAADADYLGLREGFTQLARLIDTYTTIKVHAAVCMHSRANCLSVTAFTGFGARLAQLNTWQCLPWRKDPSAYQGCASCIKRMAR